MDYVSANIEYVPGRDTLLPQALSQAIVDSRKKFMPSHRVVSGEHFALLLESAKNGSGLNLTTACAQLSEDQLSELLSLTSKNIPSTKVIVRKSDYSLWYRNWAILEFGFIEFS
ncbi:hypothetical protein [Pseudoduganella violaceinigra]|uniref:hypothetical protein n=1 Tax=Pseudoduganella violaceinigra TaxID=246602 RepID=UPI0012B64A70|nr:hypothetical protein [Pseudoduganella violaceinigra]